MKRIFFYILAILPKRAYLHETGSKMSEFEKHFCQVNVLELAYVIEKLKKKNILESVWWIKCVCAYIMDMGSYE